MKHRIVIFLFIILVLSLRPIDDYDIFMQLALGKAAIQNSTLLTQEPFLMNFENSHWLNPGWLWQIMGAAIVTSSGLLSLKIIHVLIFTIAIMLSLSHKSDKALSRGFFEAFILAILPILSSTSVRPQIFAFVFFSLTYYLLRSKEPSSKRNIILFLIFVVWQNIHPSVLAALPLIVFSERTDSPLTKICRKKITLILFCILSTLITPMGLSIFSLSKYNQSVARDIFLITEWFGYLELPLSFLPTFGFCAAISFLLIILSYIKKVITIKELILFMIYTLSVFIAVRLVVFWSLVTLPILIKSFARLNIKRLPSDIVLEIDNKYIQPCVLLLLMTGCLYTYKFSPLLSDKFPLHCIDPLLGSTKHLRVYNDHRWGGIIAYSIGNKTKIVADGRLYLRKPEWWKRHLTFHNSSLQKIEQLFNPNVILISADAPTKLTDELSENKHWYALDINTSTPDCSLYRKEDPPLSH